MPPFLSVGSVRLCPGEGDANGPLGPGPELGGLWGTLDEHTASLSPNILLAAVAATRSWTVSQRCLVFSVLPSSAELSLSVCLVLGGALWPPHTLPPGKAAPHMPFNTTCAPSVSKCLCPAKFQTQYHCLPGLCVAEAAVHSHTGCVLHNSAGVMRMCDKACDRPRVTAQKALVIGAVVGFRKRGASARVSAAQLSSRGSVALSTWLWMRLKRLRLWGAASSVAGMYQSVTFK